MLLYTSILVVSFLVAVPILIIIYETITVANKAALDLSYDEAVATTGRVPGQKYLVKLVNLDYAKATTPGDSAAVQSFREGRLASANGSSIVDVKEEQGKVTLESVCKPFKRKVPKVTPGSEAVKKPIRPEMAPKTLNPGPMSKTLSQGLTPETLDTVTTSKTVAQSLAPKSVKPETTSKPASNGLAPASSKPGTVRRPFSRNLAPSMQNAENSSRHWGW